MSLNSRIIIALLLLPSSSPPSGSLCWIATSLLIGRAPIQELSQVLFFFFFSFFSFSNGKLAADAGQAG